MNSEKSFFNQVKEVLHSYEDDYIPGSWEEFSREKRKRRRHIFMWRITGAAAVLLLFTYFSFEFFNMDISPKKARIKTLPNSEITRMVKKVNIPKSGEERIVITQDHSKSIPGQTQTKATSEAVSSGRKQTTATDNVHVLIAGKTAGEYPENKITPSGIAKVENKMGWNLGLTLRDTGWKESLAVKNFAIKLPLEKDSGYSKETGMTAYDSLTNRNDPDKIPGKDRKNMVYSFVLSPAVGNQKLNFGTGMEISYKLGNSLSFNGGVMYSSMNAERKGNDRGAGNKKLQDVALAISGFEVPLGLQYRMKNGFYAAAGISGMSVISDRLEYNYLTQTTQIITVMSGGVPVDIVRIVTQESTEQSREKIRNNIGFYTFSAGTKKAFGISNLNIGPFVKIPFNNVSSEKIKLTQGGFRVSLDF